MVSAFVSKMSQPGSALFDEDPAALKGHGFIRATPEGPQVDEDPAALKGHGFIRATNREISTRL
jgi:hypothetical protein